MLEGIVLWRLLYYTSIGMFILALILLPFNSILSLIIIFAIIALWSRIPGAALYIFRQLGMHDFFAFVIAVSIGGLAGGLFGLLIMLFSRIFLHDEEFLTDVYHGTSTFLAALSVPFIISLTGTTVTAFFIYEGILYFIYYAFVLLFSREWIGEEIAELPFAVFFDFFMNGFFIGVFGGILSNLMTKGITSGWPLFIFTGIILLFIILSRSGKKLSKFAFFKGFKKEAEE